MLLFAGHTGNPLHNMGLGAHALYGVGSINNGRDWEPKFAPLKSTINEGLKKKLDIRESRMIVYSVVVVMHVPRF